MARRAREIVLHFTRSHVGNRFLFRPRVEHFRSGIFWQILPRTQRRAGRNKMKQKLFHFHYEPRDAAVWGHVASHVIGSVSLWNACSGRALCQFLFVMFGVVSDVPSVSR